MFITWFPTGLIPLIRPPAPAGFLLVMFDTGFFSTLRPVLLKLTFLLSSCASPEVICDWYVASFASSML